MFPKAMIHAWIGLCAAALMLGGCGGSRTNVTMAGSTAFQPFAEKLADDFMAKRQDVNVTVQGGGSAMGIQSALSGAADIGMADMVELPADAAGLSRVVAARDGIALVVNPANAVSNLTLTQVRGLFDGTVANWKEVGGADKPVTVVSREAGSGTRSSFEQIVGDVHLTKNAIVQDSNGTIRETVANDPNALGYLSHGLLNEKIKAVKVDGADCTTEAIMAGRYKLVRPMFLLTKGAPAGAVRDFLDYVQSAEGQATIRNNGLIPAK